MNDIRLRDRRKPGHCWQDNELYDAFGPVIGPNAVLVYVQMTRNCYGTEIRSSSRELARDAGLSKDTVLRAMRLMERVGLLRAMGIGQRRVAEYHLTDLKELAIHYGATFDVRRSSYVFSEAKIAELKALATQRSAASDGLEETKTTGAERDISGAVGDSPAESTGAGGDSVAPPLAQEKPTTGAGEAQATSYYSKQQDKQNSPLSPSCEGGGTTVMQFETPPHSREAVPVKLLADALPDDEAALQQRLKQLPRASAEYFREAQRLMDLRKRRFPDRAPPPDVPMGFAGRRQRRLTRAQMEARVGM